MSPAPSDGAAPDSSVDPTCAELVEQLTELLDGAQDAQRRQRLLDHLRDCPGCQDYLDQYRLVVSGLGSWGALGAQELPASLRSSVLATFRARGVTQRGTE